MVKSTNKHLDGSILMENIDIIMLRWWLGRRLSERKGEACPKSRFLWIDLDG
jgi:hypothetical protein